MVKALTTGTTLRVVREVHEDESGAGSVSSKGATGASPLATRTMRPTCDSPAAVKSASTLSASPSGKDRQSRKSSAPTTTCPANCGKRSLVRPMCSSRATTEFSASDPSIRIPPASARVGRGASAEGPRLVHRPETRPGPAGCPAGRAGNCCFAEGEQLTDEVIYREVLKAIDGGMRHADFTCTTEFHREHIEKLGTLDADVRFAPSWRPVTLPARLSTRSRYRPSASCCRDWVDRFEELPPCGCWRSRPCSPTAGS